MNVFVSYATEDRKWAEELIALLEKEGLKVWDPRTRLAPGDNWSLEIGRALESANAMILLLSPSALKSEHVRHEMEYALSSKRFRDRLIPVIVKDTPQIPWILERMMLVKGAPRQASKRILGRLTAAQASASAN